jgi:murein DD-endopeptidase MepM/ murein hydrolase activator NlpD
MKKVLVILLLITVVFASSVLADNIYDLQQDLDWLDKELENTIYMRKEYQDSKSWYEDFAEQMNESMQQQLADLEFKEGRIEELKKTIDDFVASIARTELEYQEKLLMLKQRIIDGYIDSKVNLLTILADSKNISEFYEKLEIRKYVTKYDQELLKEVENLALDLTEKKARAEALQIDYEVSVRKTQIAIENIENLQEKADSTIEYSASQIAILEAREDQLEQEADRILETIRKLMQERAYAGGEMVWPVPANRGPLDKGDFYGMRMHPIFGYERMHTGIDIGAPKNANIIAANSGTVIMAGWSTGYGNRVVIDHGGGIATLYAHCNKILVYVGQAVEQGQVVALIGETGWATGPHLHFEVMEEGERVDPLKFVNQKSGT